MAEDKNERKEYLDSLRERILKDIDILKNYIEKNEPFPEKEQDIDSLVQISDNIESCLNNWHY